MIKLNEESMSKAERPNTRPLEPKSKLSCECEGKFLTKVKNATPVNT